MVQNSPTLLFSLPPIHPICPMFYQGSSLLLMGLVSACWFITAYVGGNLEAIMAETARDGDREIGR